MKLLLPLGLLGLISLAVWLVIYFLKPNYQQKMISSTFVWKLSLRYKKKKIPVSKLRNILLILCQILVLSLAAFIMTKPAVVYDKNKASNEKIIVLDASASMLSKYDGQTRFDRAVSGISELADGVFANKGAVTLIWAGPEASTVISRETDETAFAAALESVTCSYGAADVDGAMTLAEDVLDVNPEANVVLFTATKYKNKSKTVEIKDVSVADEWNAAILDAKTELVENTYTLTVTAASYGRDADMAIKCTVYGANGKETAIELPIKEHQFTNEPYTFVYSSASYGAGGENSETIALEDTYKFSSYSSIFVQLVYENSGAPIEDSITSDNEFYIYDGEMTTIKVQYASSRQNDFFIQTLDVISKNFKKKGFDIDVRIVPDGGKPANEGYDLYLYEHKMPDSMPQDGIVFMFDPDRAVDAGFTMGAKKAIANWQGDGESLALGEVHPITRYVNVSEIKLSEYTYIDEASLEGYTTLMYYQGVPVTFVKNEADKKIVVMAFDINKSNLGVSPYFPMLMYNLFDYFFPKTFEAASYDVYSSVELNARGEELTVTSPYPDSTDTVYADFPATIYADKPGTYTVTQRLMTAPNAEARTMTERFYVRVASEQSNIEREEDALRSPQVDIKVEKTYDDLLIWFAAALFAFVFIEWWLQSRKGI